MNVPKLRARQLFAAELKTSGFVKSMAVTIKGIVHILSLRAKRE
jgi:hypothetical protein